MKLGSLFDGSGGFPLAGALCGIEPVWAAEVEPYPIAVTKSRFPKMKHLGSVTDVHGGKIEPVDIITFGSPCQDLSVAGKRAGLKHETEGDDETTRSGLFVEAVRIIKEMRDATNGVYPRFAVWENVPGAFSSNGGEDFRTVLEKLIQIAEPSAVMPNVPQGGWAYADSYRGEGWSISYRTFDAQYWGVPQRRRRIYLVADFRGECAGEVLFKSQGLRGYFTEGRTPWKRIAQNAERGSATNDCEGVPYTLIVRSGVERDSKGKAAGKGALIQKDKSATLSTVQDQYLFQPIGFDAYNQAVTGNVSMAMTARRSDAHHVPVVVTDNPVYSAENHPADSRVNLDESGKVQTLTSRMGTGGGNVPMVMEAVCMDAYQHHGWRENDVLGTLTAGQNNGVRGDTPLVCERVYCLQDKSIGRKDANSCHGLGVSEETSYTITGVDRHAVAYWDGGQTAGTLTANNAGGNQRMPDKENFNCVIQMASGKDVTGCLMASGYEKLGAQEMFSGDYTVIEGRPQRYIVRRLTPTECARLQGFPDNWGHPDRKDTFTKEEYEFWLDVRNTHAIINGKATKQYTKDQMLSWYNKLHTDGAEYKLWGNGIALPNALYVMQGIAEVGQ